MFGSTAVRSSDADTLRAYFQASPHQADVRTHVETALERLVGQAYRDGGLSYLRMDETEVFERLLANPGLLLLPLARCGSELSIGVDEPAWKRWLSTPSNT